MVALKNKEGFGWGVQRVFVASFCGEFGVFQCFKLVLMSGRRFSGFEGILGVRSGVDFKVVQGFGVLRLLEIRRHGSLLHREGTGSVHHLFWNEYCNSKEASHQA